MDNVVDNQAITVEAVEADKSTVMAESKNEETANMASDSENIEEEEDDEFTYADIDLSSIEMSTDFLDELRKSMESKDSCDNLMNACSSTAQALKQTISEVLKSREKIVIAAGDSTNELESDLSRKLADFETVVSGCLEDEAAKAELMNIKHPAFSNVIITEVNETEAPVSKESSPIPEVVQKKAVSSSTEVPNMPKESSNKKSMPQNEKNADTAHKNREEASQKETSKDIKNMTEPPISPVQLDPITNANTQQDKSTKKQQKSGVNKKKEDKSIDQILKSLSNCSSTEAKLHTLCKRHLEAQEELRLLDPRMKQLERQVQNQQREKEQLQADYNRMVLAKSRLESLCRELQRQNRAVKEESLLRIKEEEERRKEIANKFQTTLNDISTLMQEHSKKNFQLREENAELAKKLKALVDHYDMWEKHMEKVVQQNHLEAQLAKAKYAKINLLLKQETEKFLREKQGLLENMSELQKKCTQLTANELKLRTELSDYTSKYEEFQTVLNKSSQVFSGFKNDMEATSKKIKKLEKETNIYKHKWESSNNALLGMINDKQKHDKELINSQQRVLTLEKLCRALQAERNELQNKLNAVSGLCDSNKKDVPPPVAATAQT